MSFQQVSRLHLAGIAAVLGMLAVVPAVEAQNYQASAGLTVSRHGSMRCADFAALGAAQQRSLVRRMTASVPVQSLIAPIEPSVDSSTGMVVPSHNDGAAVQGTPLSAGALIAACQSASPDTSLKDAYSKFNYSSRAVPL